jgi:alkylated DNA repair dioxygenase AlkB
VQLSLFARSTGAPSFDAEYRGLHRTELGDGAWLDHQPGWVSSDDGLFELLDASVRLRHERRPMYDRVVDVPRLVASLPEDGPIPPLVEAMRQSLSSRYGEDFVRVSLALYRDGNDSVAWHGDTTARDLVEAVVATVSLGAPRRFSLRPTTGGRSRSLPLGRGDLLVMGGTCQRTWRHAIPKVASAAPRLAVMFRPHWTPPEHPRR